jgi:hypothetical protein
MMAFGRAVAGIVNSGNHKIETKSNTTESDHGGAKAMYASAAADARLSEGQLNLNADAGAAKYSTKEVPIVAEPKGGGFGISLDGGVSSATANAYVGLRDSAIGGEAGISFISYSGAFNIKFYGRTVKVGGNFDIGSLSAGASIGLKSYIKLGLGLGAGVNVEFIPKSK